MKTRRQLYSCIAALLFFGGIAISAAPVLVSVNTQSPGAEVSNDALGLSYETGLMLPNENGVRYFRPDNKPLVQMFRTLGIRSLRIGGNSVDAARWRVPEEADIRSLFQFAKAADVKVIYSVRLEDGDPQSAANIAKFIRKHHAKSLECFAIGNEPKGYYKDTNVFLAKWTSIRDAILAVWPEAQFCGPDDNPSQEWCTMLVKNFAGTNGHLKQITQHSYSFGCSYKNPREKDVTKLIPVEVPAAREKMLSPDAYAIYEKILRGITNAIGDAPVSFRMTEVNSYWFSGLKGASDSYASALWGVDYLHWWTAHSADGLNFHTGDRTGGAITMPCRYAAFVSSAKGYEARPLAYGMKLFSLGGQGKILTTSISTDTNQNIVAYATLAKKKTACVTLINKTHGGSATNSEVQIKLDAGLAGKTAQVILLTAQDGDIAAGSSAVTLGGAAILEDGTWEGRWTSLPIAKGADTITLTLPPASAAVVKFKLD